MVNDVLTARVEAYTYNSMLPVILMDSHNRESVIKVATKSLLYYDACGIRTSSFCDSFPCCCLGSIFAFRDQ